MALVVGNGEYEHTTPLLNPRNDAVDMARALEGLGFEVIKGFDLDERGLESKLREFSRAAHDAEVTLFFYAGHGLQVDGENYLVPTDAKLVDEVGLRREAFELAAFLREMRGDTNIVLLDACRDNPLARGLARSMVGTRSSAVGRGLGRLEPAAGGTLIAYATQPGNVAVDGEGRNSPFTEALLANIATPGRSVNDVLAAVTGVVLESTNGRQEPWVHTSLREPFYFKLEVVADVESDAEEAARLYEAAERVATVEAYALVPGRFPQSPYAELARLQIAKLEAERTSSAGASTATDASTAGASAPPALPQQAPGVPAPEKPVREEEAAGPAPEVALALPTTGTAGVVLNEDDLLRVVNAIVSYHFWSSLKRTNVVSGCYFDSRVEKSMECAWRAGGHHFSIMQSRVKRDGTKGCRKRGGETCSVFWRNGRLKFDSLSPRDSARLDSIMANIASYDSAAGPLPGGIEVRGELRERWDGVREHWEDFRQRNRGRTPHYAVCANGGGSWAASSMLGAATRKQGLSAVREMCILKCRALTEWNSKQGKCYLIYENGKFASAAAREAMTP